MKFDVHKIARAMGQQPHDARKLGIDLERAWDMFESVRRLKKGRLTRWSKVAKADDCLIKAKRLVASEEFIKGGGIIEKIDEARARIAELAPVYKQLEATNFIEPRKVLMPKLQKIFVEQFGKKGRSSDRFLDFVEAVELQAGALTARATSARALSK